MAAMHATALADRVVKHLGLALLDQPVPPSPAGGRVNSAAIAQARSRIGSEPLAERFRTTARSWTEECPLQNRWRDLSVFAIDGSTLRIPDTSSNEETFGRPGSSRSKAGYPQARVVEVLAVTSRVISDLVIGALEQSETVPVRPSHRFAGPDRGFRNQATRSSNAAEHLDRAADSVRVKGFRASRLRIAHNLLRVVMARAALVAGTSPARMSFRNSLLELRDFFSAASTAAPNSLPDLYRKLCTELAWLVLPERRARPYLRAVKIKMSNYKRKTQRRHVVARSAPLRQYGLDHATRKPPREQNRAPA